MAQSFLIEQLDDESWDGLTNSFMRFCIEKRGVTAGGCHEGDCNPSEIDGKTFASVAFPDHCHHLIALLPDWAKTEGRVVLPQNHGAEQGESLKP